MGKTTKPQFKLATVGVNKSPFQRLSEEYKRSLGHIVSGLKSSIENFEHLHQEKIGRFDIYEIHSRYANELTGASNLFLKMALTLQREGSPLFKGFDENKHLAHFRKVLTEMDRIADEAMKAL